MCQHCKSSNTILTKDTEARLHTKECKNCKATMSVSTLKLQKKKEKWKKLSSLLKSAYWDVY